MIIYMGSTLLRLIASDKKRYDKLAEKGELKSINEIVYLTIKDK